MNGKYALLKGEQRIMNGKYALINGESENCEWEICFNKWRVRGL